MPLPDDLRSFWYRRDATKDARRTRWGMVFIDPRFPLVWEANRAGVLEELEDLTLEELRKDLLPPLEDAGAAHEHVEFWGAQSAPAVNQTRAATSEEHHDVVMVFEGPAPVLPNTGVVVREIKELDDEFLSWYRASRNDFGDEAEFSDQLIDQLYRRDLEEFAPRGLRFFVGFLNGKRAGLATLFSLGGVGYIDHVVTKPEFRRRGVASALMAAVVEASRDAGDRLLHLLADQGAPPQRLYERLGFGVWSTVVSFTRRLR
jgi:GNAT superfamily N-acetyltransferase